MHGSHHHAHKPLHPPAVETGISLLRLSAAARLSIALALSVLIWLLVYLVVG